ncbi:MAG: hypothetical protein CL537_07765 [Alcanivoracaceae bacterium]|nr:hypothetical protein [Alcanivoracaceae bacterium]
MVSTETLENQDAGSTPQENQPPGNDWADMAQEFGLNFDDVEGVDIQPGPVPEPGTGIQAQPNPATDEEKLFAAEAIVLNGLKFVVSTLFDLEVPDKKYEELATSTARVIVKWYKGGIFEFMAKWREEIAFSMAMLAFIAATREAVKVKKAKEVKAPDDNQEGGEVPNAEQA